MYATIRQAIIDKITASATTIQAAYRTDRSEISGYPAALVFPSEAEADYFQTAAQSNREVYIFTIRVIYPFTEGQEEADISLEAALDELLTIFRDRTALGAACDWVEPVPSIWGYMDRPSGQARVGELKLRAVKYVEGG